MKPVRPDCMVFYSANSCLCYDSQHSLHQTDTRLTEQTSEQVDTTCISKLQAGMDEESLADKQFALIVVPDAWLSMTEHVLDHAVPKQMAPLAALAFAVEHTFASPETLWLHHQLTRHGNASTMTVTACASDLAQQLCAPFAKREMAYSLVSYRQWQAYQAKAFGLYRLAKQGLTRFDPDAEKHHHARNIWLGFAAASVVLQVAFISHDYRLHQELSKLTQQRAYEETPSVTAHRPSFLASVLVHIHSLPATVRVSAFTSDDQQARVMLSLPQDQVQPLLKRWHQEEPGWVLKVDYTGVSNHSLDISRQTQQSREVANVAVSITPT